MHACVHAWNDIAVFGLHSKKDVIDCCCCEGNSDGQEREREPRCKITLLEKW